MEAIINSMTPKERERPDIIKGSRKKAYCHRFRHASARCEQAIKAIYPNAKNDEKNEG